MAGSIWTPDPLAVPTSFKAKNALAVSAANTEIQNWQGESNDTPDFNNQDAWSSFFGRFTANKDGIYLFEGLITFTSAATVGVLLRIGGNVNNSELVIQKTTSVSNEYIPFAVRVKLLKNEYVSLWTGVLTAGNCVGVRFSGGIT